MEGLHLFTLRGIPVRASLWFFLLVAYYGYSLRGGGAPVILGFGVALTVSVLVHEFGHAFVARRFKLNPQVVLHGWGGLCMHERANSDRDDALIIFAGPAAGLALAALVALAEAVLPQSVQSEPFVRALLMFMWYINFWWSLINLLPLYPLDGGQLFRLAMLRWVKPTRRAEQIVHGLGAVLALAGVIWGAQTSSILLLFFGVMLLMQNVQLYFSGSSAPVRRRNTYVDELLAQSREAMAAGDAHEARRLVYQARQENNLAPDQVDATFVALAVSSAALDDWEEAQHWAAKAPPKAGLRAIYIEGLARTGRTAEARRVLAETEKLDSESRARLESLVSRQS